VPVCCICQDKEQSLKIFTGMKRKEKNPIEKDHIKKTSNMENE
jgi:hypothetical protein